MFSYVRVDGRPGQVNPERYFEHAEQVTPDDKPLDYVRLKAGRRWEMPNKGLPNKRPGLRGWCIGVS